MARFGGTEQKRAQTIDIPRDRHGGQSAFCGQSGGSRPAPARGEIQGWGPVPYARPVSGDTRGSAVGQKTINLSEGQIARGQLPCLQPVGALPLQIVPVERAVSGPTSGDLLGSINMKLLSTERGDVASPQPCGSCRPGRNQHADTQKLNFAWLRRAVDRKAAFRLHPWSSPPGRR